MKKNKNLVEGTRKKRYIIIFFLVILVISLFSYFIFNNSAKVNNPNSSYFIFNNSAKVDNSNTLSSLSDKKIISEDINYGENKTNKVPLNYQVTQESLGNGRFRQTSYLGFSNFKEGEKFKPINTTITSYNKNGYSYALNTAAYKLYFKSKSDFREGIKFCVDGSNKEYCLIYQPQDYSYRNQDGAQDDISSIKSSEVIVNDSVFTYPNIYLEVNLSIVAENGLLKERYIISSLPKVPADSLGEESRITLDFGSYFKFDGLNIYVDGVDMSGQSFVTSNEIYFVANETTLFYFPKPYAYDSAGNSIDIQYEVKKQGNKILFYVKTPYSWLSNSSRVYPVYIDPSVGPTSPGRMSTSNENGATNNWTTAMNARTSNNQYATITNDSTTTPTYFLRASNFGFSIPAGVTIKGITVQIERKGSLQDNPTHVNDDRVSLIAANGTILGNNYASGTFWPAADTNITYGGSTNLWGLPLTQTDINDVDFGVAISVWLIHGLGFAVTGSVDAFFITVDYSLDTCTYTSGNWNLDCNDNCTIISNVNLGGNNLSMNGSGNFTLNANLTNYKRIVIPDGCRIIINANSKFF
jgi:hypothetical protein